MNTHSTLRRVLRPLAVVAWFAATVACLQVAQAWWLGELAQPGWAEWTLIALLPVQAWVWWRHLSLFRPGCDACDIASHRPHTEA